MYNGYGFYMDGMLLPVTPPSLKITVGSTNKTVTLINEGEINILKSPSLTEVTFEARFPYRKYPFARDARAFDYYYDKFVDLKESKKPFHFIVLRHTPNGVPTWNTDLTVALETFDIKESADEGDDVLVSFKLKQWKNYGTKTVKVTGNKVQVTKSNSNKVTKEVTQTTWTVKSGDTLWLISKSVYGDGSKWEIIYNANKNAIEADAKKHGKADSRNGHWIYPNLVLTIPNPTNVSTNVSNSSSNKTPTVTKSEIKATIPRGFEKYALVSIAYGEGASRNYNTGYSTVVTTKANVGNTVKLNLKFNDPSYRDKFAYWIINGTPVRGSEGMASYSFKATANSYNCVAQFKS